MHARMLRSGLATLLLAGLCSIASAETSNWALNRTPDILARVESTAKPAPRKGGGGTTSAPRPTSGPPCEIVIVTQPPQADVRLETGKIDGIREDKPDLSRTKFDARAGKRRLIVEKPGYQKAEMIITLQAGDNAPILVQLQKESYEVLFRELIQVYKARYEANHNDGNALLHYLYLSRLIKDYRTVDRLSEELKANPNIDVREETVRLQRYADETMAALEANKKRNEELANNPEPEPEPVPPPTVEKILIGPDGKPIGKIGNKTAAERAAEEKAAMEATPAVKNARPIYMNPFFYPGFVGYLKTIHLNRPDEGLYYLRGALETELSVPLLWYDAGLAYGDQGKYTEAYNSVHQAYMIDEQHAWVLSELSYLSNLLGRMSKDRELIDDGLYYGKKAIEKDPQYIGGYLNLVTLHQMNNRNEDALSQIRAAIAMDSDNPELYGVYGDVLADSGDLNAAEAQYSKSLQLKPSYTYGTYGLGKIAEARGDKVTAKSKYAEAYAAENSFVEPLLRLAWLEQEGGDEQSALNHYYEAIQQNEGLFDPWYQTGMILFKHKKYAEAAPYLYRAFELNSQQPWVLYTLGEVSQQMGDKQKALDFYDAFTSVYTTQDDYYQRASSFVKSAKTLFNLVPTKYQTEDAAAGDDESFIDQFFGEEEGEESGSAGDLVDNFKPKWAQDKEPPRGNISNSGG